MINRIAHHEINSIHSIIIFKPVSFLDISLELLGLRILGITGHSLSDRLRTSATHVIRLAMGRGGLRSLAKDDLHRSSGDGISSTYLWAELGRRYNSGRMASILGGQLDTKTSEETVKFRLVGVPGLGGVLLIFLFLTRVHLDLLSSETYPVHISNSGCGLVPRSEVNKAISFRETASWIIDDSRPQYGAILLFEELGELFFSGVQLKISNVYRMTFRLFSFSMLDSWSALGLESGPVESDRLVGLGVHFPVQIVVSSVRSFSGVKFCEGVVEVDSCNLIFHQFYRYTVSHSVKHVSDGMLVHPRLDISYP